MPLINGQVAMNVKTNKRESDAFKLDLIKFVEKHPALYDTTLENYKSKSKEQLWLQFAMQYEVDTAEVRREWNSLRTYYNSYIKRVQQHMNANPNASGSKRKKWKFANDMCRRRNWVSALLGSDVKKVPLSGPTPTPDRTTPWASMARIASRTAARLTPSFAARSRSAGNWSPTFSAPAIIWLSIWLITSS